MIQIYETALDLAHCPTVLHSDAQPDLCIQPDQRRRKQAISKKHGDLPAERRVAVAVFSVDCITVDLTVGRSKILRQGIGYE